jgi:hypothetical protein
MALVFSGCGSSRGWSLERAESVRVVRGYTLRDVGCRSLRQAFACKGVFGNTPVRAVLVTYVVHPRGSGYSLSNVRFRAFGVP